MAQLLFRCPYTNQPIASGIELDAESVHNVTEYPISLPCPHCGLQHHGTIADGCLTDAVTEMTSPSTVPAAPRQ